MYGVIVYFFDGDWLFVEFEVFGVFGVGFGVYDEVFVGEYYVVGVEGLIVGLFYVLV